MHAKKRNLHHGVTGQRSRQCLVLWVTGTEENPESVTEHRSIILDLRRRVSKKHQAIISSVVDDIDVQVVFVHIVSQNEVASLFYSLPSLSHCNSNLL